MRCGRYCYSYYRYVSLYVCEIVCDHTYVYVCVCARACRGSAQHCAHALSRNGYCFMP